MVLAIQGCQIVDPAIVDDPNHPTAESVKRNATIQQLEALLVALESRHRSSVSGMSRVVGTWGREVYPFSASEPASLRTYMGLIESIDIETQPSERGTAQVWNSPYSAIKQANLLIEATDNTDLISVEQRNGLKGIAKTLQAFEYIIPAITQKKSNGIRIDVSDPLNPGPFVDFDDTMIYILNLLDEAKADLQNAGSSFSFKIPTAYTNNGFNDPASFITLNRAIYARAAVYAEKWPEVFTALDEAKPFFELNYSNEALNKGAYFEYAGPPDSFNPYFYVRNVPTTDILMVANSITDDLRPDDLRRDKFFKRDIPVSLIGVSSEYQDNRIESQTSPLPWLRNEELILIYAEALAQANDIPGADDVINEIRGAWGLSTDYDSQNDLDSFHDELMYQRRYSLFLEFGHRWIDSKRLNRLDDLPKDGGKIWRYIARPLDEINWDANNK